jgi:hypothetical protein
MMMLCSDSSGGLWRDYLLLRSASCSPAAQLRLVKSPKIRNPTGDWL